MADVPKRYFQRFFLLLGFMFVALLLISAFWIHDKNKLEKLEVEIATRFEVFKSYNKSKDYYFPSSIKILDPRGKFIPIRKFGGKYTILNIWATWCSPCVKELPSLNRLNKMLQYDSGWRVIAVSIDSKKNLPKVAIFTERYGIYDIANYHDYNFGLQKNINISKLPMTLIISKSGRVLYEMHGKAVWHDRSMVEFLELVRKVY